MSITHELAELPEGSERLDAYMTRRWPGRNWFIVCDTDCAQVRDYFDSNVGSFTRNRWFVQWWDGRRWHVLGDLEPGRRPRMHGTYCYVVPEGGGTLRSP